MAAAQPATENGITPTTSNGITPLSTNSSTTTNTSTRTSTPTRPGVIVRRPSTLGPIAPPPLDFITGKWYITHSTLPIWRDKRNVSITYTLIEDAKNGNNIPRLDDVVEFQTLTGEKIKQVKGTQLERDPEGKSGASWNWQGKGLIRVASAHWEVLGWGGETEEDQWMVTYFVKTVFTPEGMNVYSRRPAGTSDELLDGIQKALLKTGHANISKLATEIYEVGKAK